MKGTVFNILNEMVEEVAGYETWEAVLTEAGSDGIFISSDTYPDEDLLALVGALSKLTGTPADDLVFAFGQYMTPYFAREFPMFFTEGSSLREFLLTVDKVIHVEVRKLYPDAELPTLAYDESDPTRLVMHYSSPRKMCRLAEGLIDGAAQHFGETYDIHHDVCMHRASDHCELDLRFHAA